MRRTLATALIGGAAASGGGTIKLNWSDCGDSSTHGHITSLSPTSVTLGAKTSISGKGKLDEPIPGATYKVVAKEGFIPIFSHSGDACKPDTIKLPAGAGKIDMKGFKCPLSPGAAELDLDLTLSSSIPAKLARITIDLTAQSSSGDKALCVQIKTAPEKLIMDGVNLIADPALVAAVNPLVEESAHAEVEGGTLKLNWNDCGDSSTHAKVTGLSPTALTLGQKTTVTGSGNVNEQVTGGAFTIVAKYGPVTEHYDGNVCAPKTFKLPAMLGTITWDGLKCPIAKGSVSVGVDVQLSRFIPARLAKGTIEIKATGSSKENLICLDLQTSAEQAVSASQQVVVV